MRLRRHHSSPRRHLAALTLLSVLPAGCLSFNFEAEAEAATYLFLSYVDPEAAEDYAEEHGMEVVTVTVTVDSVPGGRSVSLEREIPDEDRAQEPVAPQDH